jgi:hypothetical protein
MADHADVWGVNYTTRIHLDPAGPTLEVTTDVGDTETTVVLDDDGVHNLILALQRYERARKAERAGL